MLDYIKGTLTAKNPTLVVMECNGLGYQVHISLHTYSRIQHLGECRLFTYLHISGGMQSPMIFSLYGFYEENEREVFTSLLSVSGVGAATVRVMLSSMSPLEIQQAIVIGNSKLLESIKGIGPKSAQRIILELKDRMAKGLEQKQTPLNAQSTQREEALAALVMLGTNRTNAEQLLSRILRDTPDIPVEEMIKQVLQAQR